MSPPINPPSDDHRTVWVPVAVSALQAVAAGRVTAQTLRAVTTVEAIRLGSRSGRCYASPNGLSNLFGGHVSPSTVRRALAAARAAGILTATEHPDGRTDYAAAGLAVVDPTGDPAGGRYVLVPDTSLHADAPAAVWVLGCWLRHLARSGMAAPTTARLAGLMRASERTVERYRAGLAAVAERLGIVMEAARGRRAIRYRITRRPARYYRWPDRADRRTDGQVPAAAGGAVPVDPTGLNDDAYSPATKPLRGLGSRVKYSGSVGTSPTSSARVGKCRSGTETPAPRQARRPRRRRRGAVRLPEGVSVEQVRDVLRLLPTPVRAAFDQAGQVAPRAVVMAAATRLATGATLDVLATGVVTRWAGSAIAVGTLPGLVDHPARRMRSPIAVALWLLGVSRCGRVDCAAGWLLDVDGSRYRCGGCAEAAWPPVPAPAPAAAPVPEAPIARRSRASTPQLPSAEVPTRDLAGWVAAARAAIKRPGQQSIAS